MTKLVLKMSAQSRYTEFKFSVQLAPYRDACMSESRLLAQSSLYCTLAAEVQGMARKGFIAAQSHQTRCICVFRGRAQQERLLSFPHHLCVWINQV
jgi:hypothetical protein